MPSNNTDHADLDESLQTDIPKTVRDEAVLLEDDLIGCLPLLAANDFLD